jgi:hypothetical protein
MFSEIPKEGSPPEIPRAGADTPSTSVVAGAGADAADAGEDVTMETADAPTTSPLPEPTANDVEMGGETGGASSSGVAPPEADAASSAATTNPSRIFESFAQSWESRHESGKRDSPETEKRESKRSRMQNERFGGTGGEMPDILKGIWASKDVDDSIAQLKALVRRRADRAFDIDNRSPHRESPDVDYKSIMCEHGDASIFTKGESLWKIFDVARSTGARADHGWGQLAPPAGVQPRNARQLNDHQDCLFFVESTYEGQRCSYDLRGKHVGKNGVTELVHIVTSPDVEYYVHGAVMQKRLLRSLDAARCPGTSIRILDPEDNLIQRESIASSNALFLEKHFFGWPCVHYGPLLRMRSHMNDDMFKKGHGRLWGDAMLGSSFLCAIARMLRELPSAATTWRPGDPGDPIGINTGGWMLIEQLIIHAFLDHSDDVIGKFMRSEHTNIVSAEEDAESKAYKVMCELRGSSGIDAALTFRPIKRTVARVMSLMLTAMTLHEKMRCIDPMIVEEAYPLRDHVEICWETQLLGEGELEGVYHPTLDGLLSHEVYIEAQSCLMLGKRLPKECQENNLEGRHYFESPRPPTQSGCTRRYHTQERGNHRTFRSAIEDTVVAESWTWYVAFAQAGRFGRSPKS